MKKRHYFPRNGAYPIINIILSKLIFWGLRHRRKWLLRNNRNLNKKHVQFVNNENTRKSFLGFLEQGFSKINIGGGSKNLEGFINIEFVAHNTAREVIANILDLSFIPDDSLSQVHSNHVIEHLTAEQLDGQLNEYHRILKSGGTISIRCPNSLGVAYGFFFGQTAETNHEEFIALGYPKDEEFYNPLDGWYYQDLWGLYHWWFAETGNIENEHLNQLTPTKITKALESRFKILKISEPETSNIVIIGKK